MPEIDIDKWTQFWDKLGGLAWNNQQPQWWSQLLGIGIVVVVFGAVLSWLAKGFRESKKFWTEDLSPLLANPETRSRTRRRRRLADFIVGEMDRVDRLEDWADARFADLEAEVEANDTHEAFSFFPFRVRTRQGLRRVRSLSYAIETSRDDIILVEGQPGTGKSVALRHVARSMAQRVKDSRGASGILPVYINLKELQREDGAPIDRTLIEKFVHASLSRGATSDLDQIAREEYPKSLETGKWFFLFDSFDELPDVLSSIEADAIIKQYREAIADLLQGYRPCRGVIASRHFRGTGFKSWPLFQILRLDEKHRRKLIRRFDMGDRAERDLIAQLGVAGQDVRLEADVPMFLGLLCSHLKAGNEFPKNIRAVFESYVSGRFTDNAPQLEEHFKLSSAALRTTAETIAFAMAADPGLGLSPSRPRLRTAVARLKMPVPRVLERHLDALEYIKLARMDTQASAGQARSFTFVHRRFQEYFATSVVLREPERVSPAQLLGDARWRETAVVIAQTRPKAELVPLVDQARGRLAAMNLLFADFDMQSFVAPKHTTLGSSGHAMDSQPPTAVRWPPGSFHLLGILQEGFARRLGDLPDDVRAAGGRILAAATKHGTLGDKRAALEIAGISPEPVLLAMLRDAFGSRSQWLKDAAYWQVARLAAVPPDIERAMRIAIVGLYRERRLRAQEYATRAHVGRLDNRHALLTTLQLLLWSDRIDMLFLSAAVAYWFVVARLAGIALGTEVVVPVVLLATLTHAGLRFHAWETVFVVQLRLLLGLVLVIFLVVGGGVPPSSSESLPAFLRDIYYLLAQGPGGAWFRVAYAFLASWAPALPSALAMAPSLSPIVWLAPPVFAIWQLLKRAKVWYLVVVVIGVVLAVVLVNLIVLPMSSALIEPLMVLEVLAVAWIVVVFFYQIIDDRVKWGAFADSLTRKAISFALLVDTAGSFHRSSRAVRLTRAVSERGLLEATPENESQLTLIAVAAELQLAAPRPTFELRRRRPATSAQTALDGLPRDLRDHAARIALYRDADLVDELYKLLLSIRTRLQESDLAPIDSDVALLASAPATASPGGRVT